MVFKYISTKENPADITSHGISMNNLFKTSCGGMFWCECKNHKESGRNQLRVQTLNVKKKLEN